MAESTAESNGIMKDSTLIKQHSNTCNKEQIETLRLLYLIEIIRAASGGHQC
jgi:hypothetical protein